MSSPEKNRIAVLNAGSSSIKFAIYEDESVQFHGQVEQLGVAPHMLVKDTQGATLAERRWPADHFDHREATQQIFETAIALSQGARVNAVGHRVAHGGTRYAAPVRIEAETLAFLHTLEPLAPLHQPHNLAAIEAVSDAAPQMAQVACFDTAFHSTLPQLAQQIAVPRRFFEAGVRRYGFHGLSYEYITSRLKQVAPELTRGRTVIAHLGNGASLCALQDGKSVACTMGFTAVDGLMMGTRCGSVDPGVLLHMMDAYSMGPRAIEDLVYRKSGLLGVSGVSSDMRNLRSSADPAAAEAIALFVYRIVREIGSSAAAMGGIDGLVFSGGIGEHDAATRAEVCEGCRWLGVELDPSRNAGGEGRISADASKLAVWVVPTDEERMIARHTEAVLGLKSEVLAPA
jgi:acetate kinase